MEKLDGWSLALLVAAGYVAVTTLMRLMSRRRNQMTEQFRHEVEKERKESSRKPPSREHVA
jgi:hypothetical protein